MPKPKAPAIPEAIQQQVHEIVQKFNATVIKNPNRYYVPRFKGLYLYLDRVSVRRPRPICRLKYNGQIDHWDFAIFKYSREVYDPDEWMFPGSEHINGTVAGAMQAGLKAYPD